MSLGILVHGGNHFIVRGPKPDYATAAALARHWSIITIGGTVAPELERWSIVNRAYREDLEWAICIENGEKIAEAVGQLLKELTDRGIGVNRGESL